VNAEPPDDSDAAGRRDGRPTGGRVVAALGRRWYCEVSGRGPVALLVHGTGASTRSWRDVAPRLAARCTVVAVDLPGHGRTEAPPDPRMALGPMADDLAAMLEAEGIAPAFAVGHSAGVAVLLAMALRRPATLRLVVGFGAALVPPPRAYDAALAPLVKRVASTEPSPTRRRSSRAAPAWSTRCSGARARRCRPSAWPSSARPPRRARTCGRRSP
jgi:magnesium chelatase accessory protein